MKPDGNALILCAKDSARSPMAEALGRRLRRNGLAFRDVRDGIERRVLEWLRDPDVGFAGVRK